MSSCEDIQASLYGARLADEPLAPPVQAHVASCAACRACLDDLQAMASGLRNLELPELPGGFELALRRRLVSASSELAQQPQVLVPRQRRRLVPALIAAAATVLVVAGALFAWQRLSARHEAEPAYHRLHLSIRTQQHHPQALLQVQLPPQVSIVPQANALADAAGGLRWTSALEPGTNEIDLPLLSQGRASDPGRIVARLTVGGRTTTTTVELGRAAATWQPDRRPAGQEEIRLALVVAPETEGGTR